MKKGTALATALLALPLCVFAQQNTPPAPSATPPAPPRADTSKPLTARISLEQVNEGFAALKRGEAIRSVVTF